MLSFSRSPEIGFFFRDPSVSMDHSLRSKSGSVTERNLRDR